MPIDISELQLDSTGTCFDDAIDFYWSLARKLSDTLSRSELKACLSRFSVAHGVCQAPNQSQLYSHAWVEERDDTGRAIRCWSAKTLIGTVRVYYPVAYSQFYIAHKAREVTLYSFFAVIEENLLSGHHGPWLEKYVELAKPRPVTSADDLIDSLGLRVE